METRASKRRRMNLEEEEEKEDVKQNYSKPTKDNAEIAAAAAYSDKSPVVVFAHGAAAPSSSHWMIR